VSWKNQVRSIFVRANEDLRGVLIRAEKHASRLGESFLSTEHLLLGLVDRWTESRPEVFVELHIDAQTVRDAVDQLHGLPTASRQERVEDVSPRAKAVIENAVKQADFQNRKRVRPEHLFLALLNEEVGTANQLLRRLGVTNENAFRAIGSSSDWDDV
jgi:ATP-dependent Clp protease ATP-binding subunit ClpC